jgi:DNA-directed RNA polymerase I, II, and III subunit RPABC1
VFFSFYRTKQLLTSTSSKGYVVSQEEIDTPLSEFREMATRGQAAIDRNNLHFYANHSQDQDQLIFIYFSDERNVGVTTMRKFLQQLEDKNIGRGIIIYQDKMTSSAHKVSISLYHGLCRFKMTDIPLFSR